MIVERQGGKWKVTSVVPFQKKKAKKFGESLLS